MKSVISGSKGRSLAIILAVLAIGMACTCNGFTAATQTPTIPNDLRTPDKPPSPPDTPSPEPLIVQGLDPAGPWMLISASDGLWAANQDGSNLVQLNQNEFLQGSLADAVQPGGDQVVLLTSDSDHYHHLALNLLSLPGGRIQKVTDLTSSQTEPGPNAGPGDTSFEAVRAITDIPSFAWSPDGTKLAFIGVMDGPSADLYLYDTASNQITRVSQDAYQDYSPAWSPDGLHILFFYAQYFGTGAGYTNVGLSSANADGSGASLLYSASSAGEELVGWRDDQTAVLFSWAQPCGSGKLRLYNILTAQETILEQGCFNTAAAGKWIDADVGAVMLSKDDGLYLLPSDGTEVKKISDDPATSIRWDQTGYMFTVYFRAGSMTTFWGMDGRQEAAPAQVHEVTMFGVIWAWTNSYNGELPGVWISGPGIDIGQIFNGQAYAPIWNFKDNTLFFFSGKGIGTDLYYSTFPSHYTDTALLAHLPGIVQNVTWVGRFW